jgi:hypothetical protein
MARLVGDSTDPQLVGFLPSTASFVAFAAGRLDEARADWHRLAATIIDSAPVALARAARAALWGANAPAAAADLAALDASGFHGPAIEADRATIRAGLAALDGRVPEALAMYRDAARTWRDLGLAWDEAMVGIDMASLLDPANPDVRAAAERSREILVRLGAAPFVERLDAALSRVLGPHPAVAGAASTTG